MSASLGSQAPSSSLRKLPITREPNNETKYTEFLPKSQTSEQEAGNSSTLKSARLPTILVTPAPETPSFSPPAGNRKRRAPRSDSSSNLDLGSGQNTQTEETGEPPNKKRKTAKMPSKKHSSSEKHSSKSKSHKSDDWAEVTEPEERRRIQNRIAQRKFRKSRHSLLSSIYNYHLFYAPMYYPPPPSKLHPSPPPRPPLDSTPVSQPYRKMKGTSKAFDFHEIDQA